MPPATAGERRKLAGIFWFAGYCHNIIPVSMRRANTLPPFPKNMIPPKTAGELVDFLHASLRYYKQINAEDLRIVLLHSSDRLLPEMSASLGAFTLKKMRQHGVEVHLNERAVRVTDPWFATAARVERLAAAAAALVRHHGGPALARRGLVRLLVVTD